MNTGLDENEAELRVLVIPVAVQMLADLHCLLDQMVEILGERRGEACTQSKDK